MGNNYCDFCHFVSLYTVFEAAVDTHGGKSSLGSLQVPIRKFQWCFHAKLLTTGKNSIPIIVLRDESLDQGPSISFLAVRQDFPFMRSFRSLTAKLTLLRKTGARLLTVVFGRMPCSTENSSKDEWRAKCQYNNTLSSTE